MSISPLWINAIRGLPKEENLQLGKMETDLKRSPPGPLALKMQKKVWEDTRPKKSAEAGWLDVQLAGCGSHDFPVARLSIWDENGVASQEVHYIAQGKHAGEDELPPGRYRVFATCRTYWGSFHDSYLPELIAEKALPIIVRAGQTAKIHLNALTAEDIYRLAVAHLQQQSALNK